MNLIDYSDTFNKAFAPIWILERLEAYLAPGSLIERLTYSGDLSVISMQGVMYIGQESYQEVRQEVPKVGTWDYV